MPEQKETTPERCTCHPDEAPVPCQHKYAFSDCKRAEAEDIAELCDMLAYSADRMQNSYSETATIARRARDVIRSLLQARA